VSNLNQKVREARKTLEKHQDHVTEIQGLMYKASGEQRHELSKVLDAAEENVKAMDSKVKSAE